MILFLLLLATASALLLWNLHLMETDDRAHRPPPRSHPVDEQFLPPASRR